MRKVVHRTLRWSARRRVKRQGPGRSFSPLWLKCQPTRHHGRCVCQETIHQLLLLPGRWQLVVGGELWMVVLQWGRGMSRQNGHMLCCKCCRSTLCGWMLTTVKTGVVPSLVFWTWQVGGGGKPGKPKQFDLPFTTRQEKLGEIIFQTKEHKPNQQIGWHLLRMAGTDKVASQVQDLLWVELWPKCHLALVSRKYSLANRLEKTEQCLVRDSFGVSFVPEFDVVFHLCKI